MGCGFQSEDCDQGFIMLSFLVAIWKKKMQGKCEVDKSGTTS